MITFSVHGTPGPQGSKRLVPLGGKAGGRSMMIESSRLVAPWRQEVARSAQWAMQALGMGPLTGPVEMAVTYVLKRPRKYYRANGQLKANAPDLVQTKPDLSKLQRSTEDALTGICYVDDSQIARLIIEKRYGDIVGAEISIRPTTGVAQKQAPEYFLIVAYGASAPVEHAED